MWVQNSCKNLAANISEGVKKKLFIAKLRSKYKSSIHYKRLVWVSKAYSFVTTLMSVQKKMKYDVLPRKNRSLSWCSCYQCFPRAYQLLQDFSF